MDKTEIENRNSIVINILDYFNDQPITNWEKEMHIAKFFNIPRSDLIFIYENNKIKKVALKKEIHYVEIKLLIDKDGNVSYLKE